MRLIVTLLLVLTAGLVAAGTGLPPEMVGAASAFVLVLIPQSGAAGLTVNASAALVRP